MRKTAFAILLFAACTAAAETFPVTNTRYGSTRAEGAMRTNGEDFFLFWPSERHIRATKVVDGQNRAGHVILDRRGPFDVAWTGSGFIAVAAESSAYGPANITLRRLDAQAQPVGDEALLVANGDAPSIAAGPESLLMVYTRDYRLRTMILSPDGRRIGEDTVPGYSTSYDVASNGTRFAVVRYTFEGIAATILDAQGAAIAERTLPLPNAYRELSIGSDGTRFVVAWADDAGVGAATLNENGDFGAPFWFDEPDFRRGRAVEIVSTPTGWTVTYESCICVQSRVHVVHLDRFAQRVVQREQSAHGYQLPTLAATRDGRMLVSWVPVDNRDEEPAYVSELPLATHTPREVTFAAKEQTLLATASSANGTLIVWNEKGDGRRAIHAGIRTHDGNWSEREILATGGVSAVAASDGSGFALALLTREGPRMLRLDGSLQPLEAPLLLGGTPRAMAWNGTHYALIFDHGRGLLFTPTGAPSAPVEIATSLGPDLWLASDGKGFLLVGEETMCQFLICRTTGVRGMRLGANLQPVDPQELVLSDHEAESAGVVWNGTEYVAAWEGDRGTMLARIPPAAGAPVSIAQTMASVGAEGAIAALADGGIAMASTGEQAVVTLLRLDGSVVRRVPFDHDVELTARAQLAPLPGGRVAYVASTVRADAPQYGSSHVMMNVVAPEPLAAPGTPSVTARLDGNRFTVAWSAAPGIVHGYRVEYRIDGGSWIELDRWFGAHESGASVRKPLWGSRYAFRVRAFNDAGAGVYSNIASTETRRQRAVRR